MATILDKLSPSAEMGERMGRSLGSGLRSLIDAKLLQLQKQAGLSALIDPRQAESLSSLPDNMLSTFLSGRSRRTPIHEQLFSGSSRKVYPNNKMVNRKTQPFKRGNKKLDADTAKIILNEVKGDRNIARLVARELGYSL